MRQDYAVQVEYSAIAKLLHWIVAACVLFMIPVGIVMARLGQGDLQNTLYDLHRSFGALVLVLMVLRLTYRLAYGAPAPELTLTPFHRIVSQAVHHTLYLLLLVQPVVGWAATSAFGAPITVFGLFRLPELVAKNEPLADRLFFLHNVLGFVIAGLVCLHISAALYHYFIRRDGVLQRMLP